MRDFFVELLKNLKNLTGVKQYEDIASLSTREESQKALNNLIKPMLNVCGTFNYIPDEHKKTIITKKVIEDKEFYGLNAKKIWQYLNSVSERYFAESHHLEVNKIEQKPLEPLSAETQKMIDDYLIQLSTGLGAKTISNVEFEKKKIIHEDESKQKRVAVSNGYRPPSKEYVTQMELRREWGRLFHDLHTGAKKDNWIPFEEWVKAI